MFSTHYVSLIKKPILSKCNECGSWFTQNIVSESDAFSLYSSGGSDTKWPRNESFSKSKSKNLVSRVSNYLKANTKVLDIGCNTGVLLDFAKLMGCFTFGIEPSKSSQTILDSKGHSHYSSLSTVTEKYDVVTAFDLVEHLHDLNSFLNEVYELLNPNGVLIILTGDVTSLSARLAGNNWWYLKAPEHIIFPSLDFFKTLKNFNLLSVDKTYASKGYKKSLFLGIAQYVRKTLFKGGYDGLSSLGPDHMLIVLQKV